eukprot:TRINITY_DN11500_c0_g2_i1.p2 TRINITY_DN11500_c0_g2~~TRINITY_DN11500_c0_g2_i1.p2  ORF type:complete len:115 (-),score=7.09 TRINITY_DN11500_c0_g2_i1:178-522(-)
MLAVHSTATNARHQNVASLHNNRVATSIQTHHHIALSCVWNPGIASTCFGMSLQSPRTNRQKGLKGEGGKGWRRGVRSWWVREKKHTNHNGIGWYPSGWRKKLLMNEDRGVVCE